MEGSDLQHQRDDKLPRRLFATDRYPNARLNVYSKPDILAFIHATLKDTPEWTIIRNSCFGQLFDIPLPRCPISGKLIHALLSRQLLTNKKYELWSVFGGHPFRFSLPEFGTLTGLPCGEFPEGYYPDFPAFDKDWKPDQAWKEIISDNPRTTCTDLMLMMKTNPDMPSSRKLQLALNCIVDGVLIANTQVHRPTPRYVRLVTDVDAFLNFPWGRESFLRTIGTMCPEITSPAKREQAVETFRTQLRSGSMRVCGFALALQLLTFKLIPSLLAKLKNSSEIPPLLDHPGEAINKHGSLQLEAVHLTEAEPNLKVYPFLTIEHGEETGWGEWDDESKDKRVKYMVRRIKNADVFNKYEWPGGDASLPLLQITQPSEKTHHKRHIYNRNQGQQSKLQVKKSPSSSTKATSRRANIQRPQVQFADTTTTTMQNDCLLAQIRQLTQQVNLISEKQNHLHNQLNIRQRGGQAKISNHQRRIGSILQSYKKKRMLIHCSPSTSKAFENIVSFQANTISPRKGDSAEASKSGSNKETEKPLTRHHGIEKSDCTTSIKTDKQEDTNTVAAADDMDTSDFFAESPILTRIDSSKTLPPQSPDEIIQQVLTQIGHPKNYTVHQQDLHDDYANTTVVGPSSESTKTPPPSNALPQLAAGQSKMDEEQSSPTSKTLNYSLAENSLFTLPDGHAHMDTELLKDALNDTHEDTTHETHLLDGHSVMDTKEPPPNSATQQCLRGRTSGIPHSDEPQDVSDSSSPPTPPTRHIPSQMETHLAFTIGQKKQSSNFQLIHELDEELYQLLQQTLSAAPTISHNTNLGHAFDNNFLLTLATPKEWTTTSPTNEVAAFCSPYFIGALTSKSKTRRFYAARNRQQFRWDDLIPYVNKPGRTWVQDTDTVYIPMCWANKHWVGLAINLSLGHIEILDPYPPLKCDRQVETWMNPICDILPYVVNSLCPNASQQNGFSPYTWNRVPDLYHNERTGDCGPITVKFMEMHAAGDPYPHMFGLTDQLVDNFRKQYAIDLYTDLIIPLYFGPQA